MLFSDSLLGFFWNNVERKFETYVIKVLATPGQEPEQNFQDALRQTSEHYHNQTSDKIKILIDDANAGAREETKQLTTNVMPKIRDSFPSYLMKLDECRWYEIFCHVLNGIKSVVNSVYRNAREAALNSLERDLRNAEKYSESHLDKSSNEAIAALTKFSVQSNLLSKIAINKTFETARWINWFLFIYGVMVMVKTVMVIVSRQIYCSIPHNTHYASLKPFSTDLPLLENNGGHAESSPIKVEGFRVDIPKGSDDTYVALHYEVRNAVPNVWLTQPFNGLIGRILSGRYFLGFLRGSTLPEGGASIVVNSPSQLVTWLLKPDEEIILRYKNLVAFSKTVRLSTEINLSLQASLFGRFVFHKAIGPGLVIIQTEGEAVAGPESKATESRRPTSLTAWELKAGFQIQSNLDWLGVYLAPYNIRKQAHSMLIYDAGPKNSRWTFLGLIRSVRIFLLPF
jgi:hypothetical protein